MTGDISPPQAIPNQFLQQQQLQNNSAQTQAQDAQQLVNKLPVGAQIVAQVTGADKSGNLTVRIAGSDLLLSSPIALAKGAALSLRVISASDNATFQLLSIDGKLPPTQAQTVSNQLQQNPPQANQPGILLKLVGFADVAPKQAGAQALVSQQGQGAAATSSAAAAQEAVVIASTNPSLVQGIVLKPTLEAIKILRDSIAGALPADVADEAVAKLPASLNSGSKIDFKITDVQTAPTPPAQATPADTEEVQTGNSVLKGQDFQRQQNQQAQTAQPAVFQPKVSVAADGTVKLNAQVVTVNGSQAVVDTALGRLVINNQFDTQRVQIGAILNLDIQKISAEDPIQQQTAIKDLFNEWPALKALHNNLIQSGAAESMNKLAGLDSLFVSRLAGFFKSVKENNLDNWLSTELMRDLDPNSRDAIKARISGDFANLTRLYHDDARTGWNTVLFPVYDGKELHQARFFVKDLKDEEERSSGKRFVVEFATGAFGEVQLDGLVRKNAAQNRFDLMVRTSNPLPDDVRAGITQIFNSSAEITGIKGSVDFGVLDMNALRPANAVLAKQMEHDKWEA